MARLKLPNALARRHLLEAGLESGKALDLARVYLAQGREVEAVDFLGAAGPDANAEAREGLVALQTVALERGDAFLLRIASGALNEEPTSETWQSLAEAARRVGRSEDADTAQRLATVSD